MNFYLKNIIYFYFLFNFCFTNSLKFSKNQSHINFENSIKNSINENYNSQNVLIAAGLSAIIPGLGQFYKGEKVLGSIYLGVETSLWILRDNYLNDARNSSSVYKKYVRDNWNFSKWIRDYYNPTNIDVVVSINNLNEYESAEILQVNDVYNLFVVNEENEDDFENYFSLSWEQAHDAQFSINGDIYSTSSDSFKELYEEICNTNESFNYICLLELNESTPLDYNSDEYQALLIEQIDSRIDNVIYTHHLYEGVGKYNMFFAGWEDSSIGWVEQNSGGYDLALSNMKNFYEYNLRANHKKNNDKAANLLSLTLLNRAISVFNILLKDTRMRMSSNLNSSEIGFNEIKLSLKF